MERRGQILTSKNLIHKNTYKLNITKENISITSTVHDYKTCLISMESPIEYFEAQIVNTRGYCRIGFASGKVELFGPLGYDKYGYSYGNKNGYGFHNSTRVRFGEKYKCGDFLSCWLRHESKFYSIHFYINGEEVEKSFRTEDCSEEMIPAISLYDDCEISLNLGPFFAYQDKVNLQKKPPIL